MMTATEISKKYGLHRATVYKRMAKNGQKPIRKKPIAYSEKSVIIVFDIRSVDERKYDCIRYHRCLSSAAILNLDKMDCGWCQKYQKSEV